MNRIIESPVAAVNETDTLLKKGIAAIEAGQNNMGRTLLQKVVRLRPNDVKAWLWLSSVVETDEEQRACLQKILAIDPDNDHAKKGLQRLEARTKPAPTISESEVPPPSEVIKAADDERVELPKAEAPAPEKGGQMIKIGEVPRKYWWLAIVIVPIVVATIQYLGPTFISNGEPDREITREPIAGTIQIAGTLFDDEVTFYTVNQIIERVQQESGEALPDNVVETLRQAMTLVEAGEFDQAIQLLEPIAEEAQLSVIYSNLGAAYQAIGNQEKARQYFGRALETDPDDPAARFNLSQLPPAPVEEARVVNFTSQESCGGRRLEGCVENLLDGNPDRGWISSAGRFPQTVVVELPGEFLIYKFSFDNFGYAANQSVKDVQIYSSQEAEDMDYKKVDTFTLNIGENSQGFELDTAVRARWIKLKILSNHGNIDYTDLMEFRVIGVPMLD